MIFGGFNDKGQLTQILMRRLNLTGDAPAPSLMPELGVGLIWENDRPEWGWLKGEFLCAGYISTGTPAAGQNATAALHNPSDSNAIIRVKKIRFAPGSGGVLLGVSRNSAEIGVSLSLVRVARRLDSRQPEAARSAMYSSLVGAPTAGAAWRSSGSETLSLDIVLAPNAWLWCYATTVATALDFSVEFTERPAQPGELV